MASRPRRLFSGFFNTRPAPAPPQVDSPRPERPPAAAQRAHQAGPHCSGRSFLGQSVPYAPNGVEIHRPTGVWLDLLADHSNIDVERALVTVEGRTPHAGEQLLPLDDTTRRLGQAPQNPEF